MDSPKFNIFFLYYRHGTWTTYNSKFSQHITAMRYSNGTLSVSGHVGFGELLSRQLIRQIGEIQLQVL